jgi:hypothetical protein
MGAGGSVVGRYPTPNRRGVKYQYKDFTVDSFIAEGVSGKVYAGTNLKLNYSDVALKFFGKPKQN